MWLAMVMTWGDFLHNAVVFAKQLFVQFVAAFCVHGTVTGTDSLEENTKVNGQVPDTGLSLQRTHAVIDGTSEVRKPFWWRALDAEFGKDFLDDLQLCVDQGNASFLVRRDACSVSGRAPARPPPRISSDESSKPDTRARECAGASDVDKMVQCAFTRDFRSATSRGFQAESG